MALMNREGERRIIELDNRRRANLARVADPKHRYYAVEVREGGVIVLTPVDVVSAVVGVKPAMLEDLTEGTFRQPPQAYEGGDW